MNPVTVARREVASLDEEPRTHLRTSLLMWCPGCDYLHRIITWQADGQTGPVWDWDGNEETPTVSPSILVHEIRKTDGTVYSPTCHSFLRAGRWEFLGDSGHHLAGQTVDMVPVPDWLLAE